MRSLKLPDAAEVVSSVRNTSVSAPLGPVTAKV
jgi:hypothetical protein